MTDIILELARAIIIGAILIFLWLIGQKENVRHQNGWGYILAGFSFLFFGMLIDITDNFPSLNNYVVIGDTEYQAFLEKVVGYLFGFILLAVGFWRWIPTVIALRAAQRQLKSYQDELETKVEERTAKLKAITEQLEKEVEERKQAEERMRKSEEHFRFFYEASPVPYQSLDQNGNYLEVNQAFIDTLGYSREEILGRSFGDIMPLEYRKAYQQRFPQFLKNGEIKAEFELLHKDKNPVYVYLEGRIGTHPDGSFKQTHCVLFNMTERKKAEAEQARLQRELQQAQKMEALGQLTGGIAHDFNNLLGIIMGYSELAKDSCISKREVKLAEQLEYILKASGRAKDLVKQMLAFSRSEAHDERPLQLQSLVEEDIKMLRSTLPTSIEIQTETEENLPDVLIDQTQLNQILMNLCVNARDAMEGKGNINIRLGLARGLNTECVTCHKHLTGDWVEFSITDTGSGIKPEVLEHIFDPFYTTKDVGKGTGMGMAVIYGIMHNHGGHILLETEVGKGTTFQLLFPPVVEETAATFGPDGSPSELRHGKGEHILVLDDEPDLVNFLGELLESNGYRTTLSTSSKEALELFKEKPDEFALLITDQTMPGMTGVELVKAMRQVSPDLPVILNTGFSDVIDAGAAAKMDIHYLEKPIMAKNLLQMIEELLRSTEQSTE